MLSGLWNFDSGKILFDEIEITENKNFIRKNIGAFIENPNFYEDLNALQNFEIIKKLYNIRNEEWYYKLISDFGIDKFINIKLKKCSLGMRQKVAIVMALLPNPDIIILDEATNSLDISAVNVLHKLLMTLKNEKIIIVSSHILEEIDSLCDDIYMLDKGKVISKTNHESNRVYVIRFKHSNQNIDLLKSGRIITQINDFTFKMECNNLNELFIECNNLKLEVASIRNESSTKLLFNGEVES